MSQLLSRVGTTPRELALSFATVIAITLTGVLAVSFFDLGWSIIEVLATATGAVTVWLLAKNRPLGWWWGIISVLFFIYVFYNVELYGEVGIQIFYLVTTFQAIWLWVRGGDKREGRRVTSVPMKVVVGTLAAFLVGWVIAYFALIELGGAAPFWDSLTTVTSITAHLWLVFRYAQSWWLWIAVDFIYIPLYLSRGLTLTSALYVAFLLMSVMGGIKFWRELQDDKKAEGRVLETV